MELELELEKLIAKFSEMEIFRECDNCEDGRIGEEIYDLGIFPRVCPKCGGETLVKNGPTVVSQGMVTDHFDFDDLELDIYILTYSHNEVNGNLMEK